MTYKLMSDYTVEHLPSGRLIPLNAPRNRHYQEYQRWLAQGNTPEPADPEPVPTPSLTDAQRLAAIELWIIEQGLL